MASLKTEATTSPRGVVESDCPLIASDRVEGTAVLNESGVKIGTIVRLMIDKVSGRVEYAVLSSGGFLGVGESFSPLPWALLNYNPEEGAYIVNLDRPTLERGPRFGQDSAPDWTDESYHISVYDAYSLRYPGR